MLIFCFLVEACLIRFEESFPTSVTIILEYDDTVLKDISGCRLWHRKSSVTDYPEKPTYIILRPQKRFLIADLDPLTEYVCKVSLFKSTEIVGIWEAKWTTSASSGSFVTASNTDRKNLTAQIPSKVESMNSSNMKSIFFEHPPKLPLSLANITRNKDKESSPKSISPPTPGKSDGLPDGMRDTTASGCEKRREESTYEYSVRVVKWLECQGHIEECFRVKFLTWFSLKATTHERRVVSVFVDAFIDDPSSLAGQLIHTFMDEICCEQKPSHGNGLCTRWWH